MNSKNRCDHPCEKGCWPSLTRWYTLLSLIVYLLFVVAFMYVAVKIGSLQPTLFSLFHQYMFEVPLWLVILLAIIRLAMLGKLISYSNPYSTLLSRLLIAFVYLFIPFPEILFLTNRERKVIVRDFWLPERYWDTSKIAKAVRRQYFAQACEDDDMIIVALNDAELIAVQFSEREMILSRRLPAGTHPKQVVIPKGNPWRLEASGKALALVCTEPLCFFTEKDDVAGRIIELADEIRNINIFYLIPFEE